MFVKPYFLFASVLSLFSLPSTKQCVLQVYVDETLFNRTCIPLNYSVFTCGSLAHALTNPKFINNTCFHIQSNVTLNETINVDKVSNLSVKPYGESNATTVSCIKGSAIRFYRSQNVNISGLTFEECGNLVEIDWSYKDLETHSVNVSAAISFIESNGVHVTNLIFQSSQGYALVFHNTDQVSITQNFVTNSNHIQTNYGGKDYTLGGGVFIHWQQSDSSHVSITHSEFIGSQNHDYQQIMESIDNLPYEKGAGVAVFFGEGVRNNIVRLENVTASNNSCGMGTGVYIHFADECMSNSVNAINITMKHNKAKNYGGAWFVHHDSRKDNLLSVRNSKIKLNEANVGGAVCIVFFNAENEFERIQSFRFKDTEMFGNQAQVGSAIHVQNALVHLQDVSISYSNAKSNDDVPGQGSVYALRSTLNFTGDLNILKHNNNSAVILDSSQILVGGTIAFNNNFGYNGGAIAFYEHSRLYLSHRTQITFEGNFAGNKGGAIYVLTPGPSLIPWNTTELNMYGCFIQFIDSSSKSFNGRVVFNDNFCTDIEVCDIFASSLQSCASPDEPNRSHIISHWKNFHFYGNHTSSITTNAISMHPLELQEWLSFPGDLLNPRVIFQDERENEVRESINVSVEPGDRAGIETNPAFVVDKDESIRIALLKNKSYPEGSSFNIKVKTTSDVFLEDLLQNVTFKPCRFGYTLRGSEICECDVLNNEYQGIAVCDNDNIYLERNRWVDPLETTSHICPRGFCSNNQSERFNRYIKDHQCADNRDQSSRLCSECKAGYSVKSGNSECGVCDQGSNGWIGVTLVIFFGLSIFILIVMLSNVDIMSYNINICLYSYEIIDLLYTNEQTIDPFLSVVMSIFQCTAMDMVYPSYCMWNGMNALHKVAYGYIIPTWMGIFMAILYPMVRNKRKWMQRWFKTMSIVLMMCFSDLLRVSFELLHFTKINGVLYMYKYANVEYYGSTHLPYAIVAIIVLIFVSLFCIAQIVILMRADVDLFEWLRKFEDNVCNYFKKGKRWFWIFYIVCRIVIYAIGIFLPNERNLQLALLSMTCLIIATIFAYQRPFKDDYINMVESIVLTTLAIISVMSMGIRNVFQQKHQIYFTTWIRVLSYAPLLAVVITIAKKLYKVIPKNKMSVRRASTIYHPVRVFDAYDSHQYQRMDSN